jgi:hypothetical protein
VVEPILEYVPGKGWVYVYHKGQGIPASMLQVGDRIIKAWDEHGDPCTWGDFPYALVPEVLWGGGYYNFDTWVRNYSKLGYTFEVTRLEYVRVWLGLQGL